MPQSRRGGRGRRPRERLGRGPRRPATSAYAPTATCRHRRSPRRPASTARRRSSSRRRLVNEVGDDRDNIQPGDRVLLIVENDLAFARFLLDAAREKGFKGLVTSLGAARPGDDPRVQARRHHAGHLPARHRRLARPGPAQERHRHPAHPGLRHLDRRGARAGRQLRGRWRPGQAAPEPRDARRSCSTTLRDFVGRRVKDLLVVEPRRRPARARSSQSIGGDDVPGHDGGRAAATPLELLDGRRVDCLVLDASMPDMTPDEFLRRDAARRRGPRRCR